MFACRDFCPRTRARPRPSSTSWRPRHTASRRSSSSSDTSRPGSGRNRRGLTLHLQHVNNLHHLLHLLHLPLHLLGPHLVQQGPNLPPSDLLHQLQPDLLLHLHLHLPDLLHLHQLDLHLLHLLDLHHLHQLVPHLHDLNPHDLPQPGLPLLLQHERRALRLHW